jgi:radical SAM superfamily enzyme YgiQ (UPF0313 family)
MKVSLIISADIGDSYGFNILAAQLKKLPYVEARLFYIFYKFNEPYPQNAIDELVELCRGSDLIGISLLSSAFKNSKEITTALREKIGAPIIWGGKHPSADPEECIKYADMVCLSEGEDTLLEIIENMKAGKPVDEIQGLWSKSGDKIIRNPLRPLEANLDKYFFPDYSLENKYTLDKKTLKMRPLEEKDLESMRKWYPTMMTRGCPNCCTFCTNSSDLRLRKLRSRSVGNVIREVKEFLKIYPDTEKVFFRDDCISSMPLDFIREFSRRWKKEIGLPCSNSGVIATSDDFDEKIRLLTEGGMVDFKMGIQSGCERVRRFVFARVGETDEVIKKATAVLNARRRGKINYYMITDNPYESEEELVQSIRFTSRVMRPFSLSLYSLNFYPGTPIYNRAFRDGILTDKEATLQESTMYLKNTYLNKVFLALRYFEIPPFLVDFLTWRRVYSKNAWQKFFDKLFKFVFKSETPHREVGRPKLKKIIKKLIRKKQLDLREFTRWLFWIVIGSSFRAWHRLFVVYNSE